MRHPEDVLIRPVYTEKSVGLAGTGAYCFVVHPDATKPEIRTAVELMFDVRVERVNTLNRKGKRIRNRRKFTYGKRADTKRAIVTLKTGDKIDLFEV